jgi:hypothetical protein
MSDYVAVTVQKIFIFTVKVAGKIGHDVTNWIEMILG